MLLNDNVFRYSHWKRKFFFWWEYLEEKKLGIIIDNALLFDNHIKEVCKKPPKN